MAEWQARRFLISGKVQGVFFRETTRRKALQLGVTGSAINLDDGRVQVLAWGPPAALKELEAWLWQGSRFAEVSDVSVCAYHGEAPSEFITG